MLQRSEQIKTQCTGLDAVLDGGLRRGHILEISGPPGSPKERLLIEIACVFAKAEEGVLFVGNLSDTMAQDTISPGSIRLLEHDKSCYSPPVFTM